MKKIILLALLALACGFVQAVDVTTQQVLIEVKLVETSSTVSRQLMDQLPRPLSSTELGGTLAPLGVVPPGKTSQLLNQAQSSENTTVTNGPQITAQPGQPTTFSSHGIRLNFTSTVNPNGTIGINLKPSVSNLIVPPRNTLLLGKAKTDSSGNKNDLLLFLTPRIVLPSAEPVRGTPVQTAPLETGVGTTPFNWTGPYVGIQFGYTRTSSDYSLKLGGRWDDFPDVRNEIEFRGMHEFDENGFGLGGCAGYNYQFNNNVVIGIGVAGRKFWGLDAMHETGDFPADNAGDFDVRSRFNTTGIVTFGPKVGYGWGRFLPYVSGGLAFGEIDSSQSILSSNFGIHESGKDSDLRLGWNVAAGLQYGLTNSWSLRFEYSYSDLGTFKYPGQPFPDTFHGFSSWNMATLTEHGANFGIVYNFAQFGKK